MRTTLLLDGDIFAFQASASVETPIRWDDGIWTLHANEVDAFDHMDKNIHRIATDLKADRIIIALSSKTNFRYDVYPLYKSNRKDVRKPMCLNASKQFLKENFETIEVFNLEGDDVLGILATEPHPGEKRIIVSKDKDMRSIPGFFFNSGKDLPVEEIGEEEACYWHMKQTLRGDTADGYPGLPGCGPKTADKILEKAEESTYEALWPLVVQAYEKKGYTEVDALVYAQIARILHNEDYVEGEVKLWMPPKS